MTKKINMVSTVVLGIVCAFLMLLVGINAVSNKNTLPMQVSLDMEQDIKLQIDLKRTNGYMVSSQSVTIFNNAGSDSALGNVVQSDAVLDPYGNEVPINPWYSAFQSLSYSDTLAFTVYSYTQAPADMPNACVKFTITDVVDDKGNHISSSIDNSTYISYIKCYDGISPYSGTVKITNINPLYSFTKIYIKCNMELVEYNYVILETDTYKIKEYTEAEYAKNSYGIKYSKHTTAQYAADEAGISPLTTNNYAEIAGMMGYYYYVEMGQYPQDYAGDVINTAFTRTLTNPQGYTPTDDLNSSGTSEAIGDQIITDANNTTYKLRLVKQYNQVLYTNYLNASNVATVGYKVCPIYWFQDLNTGDIYARSQVYGYVNNDYKLAKYFSTVSGNNLTIDSDGTYINNYVGEDPRRNIVPNKYDWFKVMPTKWIIYSLENGDANTIKSGSANSSQLKTICGAINNNIKLKVNADQCYDNYTLDPNGGTGDYKNNNWAISYFRAGLNGTTGTTILKAGANSATNPYTFNTNMSLTNYVINNFESRDAFPAYSAESITNISPMLNNIFSTSQQNNIATTTNTTYFSSDLFNGLTKTGAEGAATTMPYYSLSQDKLYVLSYGQTGETNAYGEYNTSGHILKCKVTDYGKGHYTGVFLREPNSGSPIPNGVWMRSGSGSNSWFSTYSDTNGDVLAFNIDAYHLAVRPAFQFQP